METIASGMVPLRREKLFWATSRAHPVIERDPLPVAIFDRALSHADVAALSYDRNNDNIADFWTNDIFKDGFESGDTAAWN